MQFQVSIDSSALKARTPREIKRLAFNTALAINQTLLRVQEAERVNLERTFTLRKERGSLTSPGFLFRLIKISTFANARQGRPFAEIAVDRTKKRVLLPIFEKGGVKKPFVGKSVAVPITGEAARPSFAQPVTTQLRISRLRFKQHRTASGRLQWKGARRTFLLPGIGIFQRGGGIKTSRRRGRKRFKGLVARTGVKLLYSFEKRPQLQAALNFVNIALKKIRAEWPRQFAAAYRKRSR